MKVKKPFRVYIYSDFSIEAIWILYKKLHENMKPYKKGNIENSKIAS